jgi:hypothetical protein
MSNILPARGLMITIQDLRDAEQRLERELKAVKNHIAALVGTPTRRGRKASVAPKKRRRSKMSAKGRAAIAAAQKKRWAKVRAAAKS